jgi:hypothetical protein
MKLFIDCEFNDSGGNLISMAIVAEDGAEFYEVLACDDPTPWVSQNVMPVLNKDPIPEYLFKTKLSGFLNWYDDIEMVSDWPEDIKHFCETLITGPGMMLNIPSFRCRVLREINTKDSKVPHNALEDARALMESYIENSLK